MGDTRHQCRWCSSLTTGNGIYCGALKRTKSEPSTKRVNRCRYFEFCEIDAYSFEVYKQRIQHMKQVEGQMRMEGM